MKLSSAAFITLMQGACVDPSKGDVPLGDQVGQETVETDVRDSETDTEEPREDSADSALGLDTSGRINPIREAFGNLIIWGTQNPDPLSSAPIDLSTGAADSKWVNVTGLVHQAFNASMEARLFYPPRTLQEILDLKSGAIVFHVSGAFWVIQKPESLSMQEVMSTPITGTNDMADLSETNVYLAISYSNGSLEPNNFGLSPSIYEANTTEYVKQITFSDLRGAVDHNGDVFNRVSISEWANPLLSRVVDADDPNYDVSPTRRETDAILAEAPVHEEAFAEWYLMGQSADPAVNQGVKSWIAPFSGIPVVYLPSQ